MEQHPGPGPAARHGGEQVGVVQHVGEERGEGPFAEPGLPGAVVGSAAGPVRGAAVRGGEPGRHGVGPGGQPAAELPDQVRPVAPGYAAGQDVGGALDGGGGAGVGVCGGERSACRRVVRGFWGPRP
ncbi:hypothetical protein I3W98_06045, partial [Streptomyces cavourensis]|nr:hypothetical protein [Streptomyces cavourensis]